MSKLKVGVIGAGAIAPSHCKGVASHPEAELAAIADVHEGRAKAMQEEFEIPTRYSSPEELIADSELDAVSIGLPTFLHAPIALKAIEAGKHVLLDKPFAMNAAEAESVVEAARKAGVIFTVGMNMRFTEDAQKVRALVERGDLGEIYHAESQWCRRSGAPRFGTWFGDKSKSGGGTLLDIGVHALDLCLHLMGEFEPVSVTGSTYTKFGHRGLGEGGWGKSDRGEHVFTVDDLASAFIKLKSGASVILKASWARHQTDANRHGVELFGTEAGVSVLPPQLCRFGEEEYEVTDVETLPLKWPSCDRMVNWVDAILGKDELGCKPEENLVVQRIIDAVYESSATGNEVKLG